MGNQPSQPQPQPSPPLTPPPVCDAECQRQNLLSGLKTTLDQKEQTKDQDPEGYEQARIAYYTALNGQGWLANEKTRLAKEDVSPKITAYTKQYEDLKKQQSSQQVFMNLMNSLKAQEYGDEQDLHFLKKQVQEEHDKADVMNRLTVLGGQPSSSNYILIILDVILAVLGLGILYMLYKKFDVIKGYFGYSSEIVGGKRLRN